MVVIAFIVHELMQSKIRQSTDAYFLQLTNLILEAIWVKIHNRRAKVYHKFQIYQA